MVQEPFFIDGNSARLYSVLFMPEKGFSNKVFLLLHPLFEEKKASHRVLVELAAALAGKGHASLMIDLRGCGDSSGEELDFAVSEWLDDIKDGTNWLQKRFGNPQIGLLGIRFGAALAVMHAARQKEISDLVLVDPVATGESYFSEVIQQKCIREMMTCGEARTDADMLLADLDKKGKVDIDGTLISSYFSDSLRQIDLCRENISSIKRVLMIQQSPRKSLMSSCEGFHKKCIDGKVEMEISLLSVPPFWKAVDMADSELICRTIVPWCR